MSLIRCFRAHATHMRNNGKKCMRFSWKNLRFTWENIHMRRMRKRRKLMSSNFSYMRKMAKTHVLIWENLVKLICSYMRKIAKTHVLIWENAVKLICDYMRKIAKNHSLIYAKTRLRICEKLLKFICKIYVEIHLKPALLYLWETNN